MSAHSHPLDKTDAAAQTAAEWMLRHDRGLTAAEQDEFSQWLAADARHRAAWAEHRWGWDELDRLAGLQTSVHAVPDPDLLAPTRGRLLRFFRERAHSFSLLAAAAAVVLGFAWWTLPSAQPPAPGAPPAPRFLAPIEQRELADGSTVELNRGAVVTEHFTPGERRVRLERGEAHFTVAKNAARPFVVEAGGVAVHAVGTAFNVRLSHASVEVLVTEGKVRVDDARKGEALLATTVEGEPTVLAAGQSAIVALTPAAVSQVATVTAAEIEARLAWQPRLLDFTGTPLAEILTEFNRHNPVRLTLQDASLGELRLSATFRSDNVEGFVRLMESDFGMKAEWRSIDEIVLSKAR